MCSLLPSEDGGKEYLVLRKKNPGIKVLPGREFTEQPKTSEKMQAPAR